jgi:hypothetical protein
MSSALVMVISSRTMPTLTSFCHYTKFSSLISSARRWVYRKKPVSAGVTDTEFAWYCARRTAPHIASGPSSPTQSRRIACPPSLLHQETELAITIPVETYSLADSLSAYYLNTRYPDFSGQSGLQVNEESM